MSADLTFALRIFKRRPIVTATIIATLGLSVGGGGAIFNVIRSVLLRPVPVRDPDRVVVITERSDGGSYQPLSLAHYWLIARSNAALASFAASFTTTLSVGREDGSTEITASLVTANYFQVLGVPPLLGRGFTSADSVDGSWTQQVVISHHMWQRQYDASPKVLGERIVLNGRAMAIVGVMPRTFAGVTVSNVPDAWLATNSAPLLGLTLIVDGAGLDQRPPVYSVVARLHEGVSSAKAQSALNSTAAAASTDQALDGALGFGTQRHNDVFRVRDVNETAIGSDNKTRVAQILMSIAALVGITMLLASINIASILSAMGHQRSAEYAVRAALGASKNRLFRQVATECALLACAGAVVAVLVCGLALQLVGNFVLPGGIALDRLNIGLNLSTSGFIVAGTLAAMLLFGAIPARQAAAVAPIGGLRSAASTAGGGHVVVLATQVTISLVLLVGAALFIRSVSVGLRTDFGFSPDGIVVLSAKSPFAGKHVDVIQPYLQMAEAIRRVPGVDVAFGSHVPLEGTWKQRTFAGPLGMTRDPRIPPVMMGVETVSDGYFRTLKVPMIAGRGFAPTDDQRAPRVVILNETAARQLFPGQSAIGQVISAGPIFDYRVVGVVRDTKYLTLNDTAVAFAYVPIVQGDLMGRIRFLASSDDSRKTVDVLRREASNYAGALKSMHLALETDRLTEALRPQRIGASLLSALAIIAVCIAAVGIYGTVSYTVSRRTAEIGVRRALGAGSLHVFSLVLQQCATAVAVGIVAGIFGAILLGGIAAHFLFRVSATDWLAFGSAVVVLICVAIAAALAPTWRALRVDAVAAIRTET